MPSTVLANWTKMVVVAGGTGNLTLAPVDGFPTFLQTTGADTDVHYVILSEDAAPIETGIGRLTDTATWVRNEVLETFSGGVLDTTAPSAAAVTVGCVIYTALTKQLMLDLLASVTAAPGAAADPLVKYAPARELLPTTTAGCAALAISESATNGVASGFLAFDANAVEKAFFEFVVPKHLAAASGLVAKVHVAEAAGATAHKSAWRLDFRRQASGASIDATPAASVTVVVTTAAGSRTISAESPVAAPAGGWVEGAAVNVTVSRVATSVVDDTLNADALLLGVALYTSSGVPVALPKFPTIADDNIIIADEGDSVSGWVPIAGLTGGTITAAASALKFSRTSGQFAAKRNFALPAANDIVLVASVRANYVAGQYGYLNFAPAGVDNTGFDINLGYNYTTNAAQLGAVSSWNYATNSGDLMAAGVDYSGYQTFAVHIDRSRNCVSIFIKTADGKWSLGSTYAGITAFSSTATLRAVTSNHAGAFIEIDYVIACRPNIVSIGDSICAGHNGYDPSHAFYAGEDNYNSTWQKHAKLYPTLRNNFIVNKGIGGQSSSQILARIAEATAHQPRVVILQASSNDVALGVSKATRTANIQACINAVATAGGQSVLINGSHATPGSADNASGGALKNYMADWWDADRLGLSGLALAVDTMLPIQDASRFLSPTYAVDGIHPNVAGYTLIGDYLSEFVA